MLVYDCFGCLGVCLCGWYGCFGVSGLVGLLYWLLLVVIVCCELCGVVIVRRCCGFCWCGYCWLCLIVLIAMSLYYFCVVLTLFIACNFWLLVYYVGCFLCVVLLCMAAL